MVLHMATVYYCIIYKVNLNADVNLENRLTADILSKKGCQQQHGLIAKAPKLLTDLELRPELVL